MSCLLSGCPALFHKAIVPFLYQKKIVLIIGIFFSSLIIKCFTLLNPMLLNLFQGTDSSTAELLKPTMVFDTNLKITQARNFKISLHGRAFICL